MSADPLILLLKSFNLSTMAQIYDESLKRAENENWGYRKFLSYMCENESQSRHDRKIKRLLSKSKLPEGKTLPLAWLGLFLLYNKEEHIQ